MFEIDDQVLKHIKRTFTLPSRPELLLNLQAQLRSDDANIEDIANIISRDVGVAAGVLKVVNSAAYGLARSVTDIKQSVVFLGLGGINTLVTGLLLKQSMQTGKCSISLDTFWDKTSHVANLAVHIYKEALDPAIKSYFAAEDVYAAALFRDCGIPAMAIKYKDYNKVQTVAGNTDKYTLAEVEEYRYKSNHAVVGYFIASTWQLPKPICQQVLRHHDRSFLDPQEKGVEHYMFAIVTLAENLVSRFHHCQDTVDWRFFHRAILDLLALDEDDYCDLLDDVETMI